MVIAIGLNRVYGRNAHWTFEATAMLLACAVVVATEFCTSLVTCRLRAPLADSRLVGSSERPDGLRKKGVVIRLDGALPALVLANSRPVFPSTEVNGSAPPDARAATRQTS